MKSDAGRSIRDHASIFCLYFFAPFLLAAPLAHHPGNIFIAGEPVSITAPTEIEWRAFDYEDRRISIATATNGKVTLGPLPIGWYRLRGDDTNQWISFAVIPPPGAVPTDSPISIDVAMSWFYPTNTMADVASLCALAGVNWVRDRLNWAEVERSKDHFAAGTRYDAAARIQSAAGLRVLQVNHITPKWAGNDSKRFATDLRNVYSFHREIAKRWAGQVLAFEPWNEADIVQFGGHTGSEMASLQKAGYLGLKAGNSNAIASLNVWAAHRRSQLDDFAANEVAPYFDTYNLHHYEGIERYPALYADHRAVSSGKPMWVTEFAMPVKWSGDDKVKELNDAELRRQSERLVKAFAASLFEGPEQSFYFMLPHYVEGQTQFGIIRADLTPRPAYVSLAAVSRFLRNARPLGQAADTNLHAYAFTGGTSEVVVAWSDRPARITLPGAMARFDHLGRTTGGPSNEVALSTSPQFALVPNGTAAQLKLIPPPLRPPLASPPNPSPIVLQPLFPADSTILSESAFRITATNTASVQIAAYNFGSEPANLPISVSMPADWKVQQPAGVRIAPGARVVVDIAFNCSAAKSNVTQTVRLAAGEANQRAVLSMRLLPR